MDEPLDDAVRELLGARTEREVYRAAVDAVAGALDAGACALATVEDGTLVPLARTPGAGGAVPVSEDLVSHAARVGRACAVDDLTDVRSAAAAEPGASSPGPRSMVCVPVDGVGVLVATSPTPGAFTDDDLAWVERLGSYLSPALDGTEEPPARRDGGPRTEDLVETIASVLSHDLAGPLSVARGSVELARETGDEDHLDRALVALSRVEELVDGVVTLARTGDSVDGVEPVELAAAAERAWAAVERSDATLEVEGSATVDADENALCELLENLFRNAVEHAGPGVAVRVGALEDGFYVEDDGPGIPAENHDRVFEWGYSSDAARQGVGLGIVGRLAEAHGWTVVLTEGADGGARFEFTDV